jgi:uncharacterized protein (DUF427 family)
METRTPKIPGPEHLITIRTTSERIVVRANGQVLAESTATLTLNEAGYPPVHYIPISDVDESLLRSSSTSTYCPYKGEASYYSIAGPDGEIQDAVWTYEHPYPAVGAIGGHLAFYPDKVEITASGSASPQTDHYERDDNPNPTTELGCGTRGSGRPFGSRAAAGSGQ